MYSPQDFVQFIFAGLTSGAIYAMVAIGFGVVHNIMGIVNFTQVDFVSLGGMLLFGALVVFLMNFLGFSPVSVLLFNCYILLLLPT